MTRLYNKYDMIWFDMNLVVARTNQSDTHSLVGDMAVGLQDNRLFELERLLQDCGVCVRCNPGAAWGSEACNLWSHFRASDCSLLEQPAGYASAVPLDGCAIHRQIRLWAVCISRPAGVSVPMFVSKRRSAATRWRWRSATAATRCWCGALSLSSSMVTVTHTWPMASSSHMTHMTLIWLMTHMSY